MSYSFNHVLERLSEAATNRQQGMPIGRAKVDTKDLGLLLDDWRRMDQKLRADHELEGQPAKQAAELATENKTLRELLALAWSGNDVSAADCRKIDALIAGQDAQPCRPELTVWYGPMPESNGKSNFTAMLMRKGGSTLDSMTHGICLDRSEYPDRVRYEADRARHLIGELEKEPCILDYDPEKHSGYKAPEEEKGSGSLEFDGLLAAFHQAVWEAAEDEDEVDGPAYDEAGNKEAKQLQAMYRAAVEGRKA